MWLSLTRHQTIWLIAIFALMAMARPTSARQLESSLEAGVLTDQISDTPVAATTESHVALASYAEPAIFQQDLTYSQETRSLAAENATTGSWRDRMRNHFHDASVNAVTSGRTVSIFGGPGLMPSRFDVLGRSIDESEFGGGVLGISIGKRLSSRYRSEVELSWRKRENDFTDYSYPYLYQIDRQLTTFAGMINTYYDFDRSPGKILTPYVGIGLGASTDQHSGHVTRIDISSFSGSIIQTEDEETAFSVQAMTGVSIHLNPQNEFYFESRAFSRFNRGGSRTSSELVFGLRRTF